MVRPIKALARVFGERGTREKKSFALSDPAAHALFGVVPTASGIHVSASSAMRVPAVAAAVGLISEAVGAMPIKVYRRADKTQAKDHPAQRLIHRTANPWTSATELRTSLTADALLRGHGFALVVRNGAGDPLELHRLDPDTVTRETTADGEPVYRVRQAKGGDRLHPWQDVLHIEAFGGVSPIVMAREAIGLAIAAEQHLSNYYAKGGRPGVVLKHEKFVSEEAKGKILQQWHATHGERNAGGVGFLDENMQLEVVSSNHTDAQFLENRVEQIREIARAFRVPPPLLMELSRATWSNAEEMGRQFLTLTLRPWLSKWEAAYERVLLTPEEQDEFYCEFVTDDLLSVDSAKRATALSQYRAAGVMTANEARAALNLPAHADGDNLDNPFTTSATTPAPTPAKEQDQ